MKHYKLLKIPRVCTTADLDIMLYFNTAILRVLFHQNHTYGGMIKSVKY